MKLGRPPNEFTYAGTILILLLGDAVEIVVIIFFSSLCPFSDNVRVPVSNEYLLAKIGVDTGENEPLEVWGKIFSIIHWCP